MSSTWRVFWLGSLVSIVLGGCGGGSGDSATSPTEKTTLSGIVADGYIRDAVVCLDQDDDQQCGSSEPRTLTNTFGRYTLTDVPADMAAKHAVIAVVPPGAYDSDVPVSPIMAGYVMTAPLGKHAFISPLTTLVSGRMQLHPELAETAAASVTAQELHIPVDSLYRNYMADATTESIQLHKIARLAGRQFAVYSRILDKNPDYNASRSRYRMRVYSRLFTRDFRVQRDELADPLQEVTLSPASEAEYMAITSNMLDEAATAPAVPVSDIFEAMNNNYMISGYFPADCHAVTDWYSTLFCADAYPGNSLQISRLSTTTSADNVTFSSYTQLWDIQSAALSAHNPVKRHPLNLINGEWSDTQPSSVPKIAYAKDTALRIRLDGKKVLDVMRAYRYLLGGGLFAGNYASLPFRADTVFPSGSVAYLYLGVNYRDDYAITDSNLYNDTPDPSVWRNPTLPDNPPFDSLDGFRQFFSGSGENYVLPVWQLSRETYPGSKVSYVAEKMGVQFANNGELKLYKAELDTSGKVIDSVMLPGGTWQIRTVSGKEIMTLRFSDPTVPIPWEHSGWTVYNQQVVSVRLYPRDDTNENLYFNATAINALNAALTVPPSTP